MIDLLLKLVSNLSFGYLAQPQIRVFYKPGASGSGEAPGNPPGIECEWKGQLVFENLTDIVAINLKIEARPESFNAPIPQGSIKPYETIEVKTVIRKSFQREIVVACHDRFVELLPDEMKHLQLLISYQNIKGKYFYTLYRKTPTGENCSWHFKCPKLICSGL